MSTSYIWSVPEVLLGVAIFLLPLFLVPPLARLVPEPIDFKYRVANLPMSNDGRAKASSVTLTREQARGPSGEGEPRLWNDFVCEEGSVFIGLHRSSSVFISLHRSSSVFIGVFGVSRLGHQLVDELVVLLQTE